MPSLREAIASLDPRPGEPIEKAALVTLFVAVAISVASFLRWKFQPMQDLGHHMALAAIACDWGRKGSIYTDVYQRFDPLIPNTLLYSFAKLLSPFLSVTLSVRLLVASYLWGVPLATLYAARAFGRSSWVALLAVPLCYQQLFMAGVANNLFAAPFFLLAIPVVYRALETPTLARLSVASGLIFAVFLAHGHVFLWLGALSFGITLHRVLCLVNERNPREAIRRAALALAMVTPSLLAFARWYVRSFGASRNDAQMTSRTVPLSEGFGAVFRPVSSLFENLATNAWKTTRNDDDLHALVLLVALVLLAMVINRRHAFAGPPVMETALALTFLSYFLLPEDIAGLAGIGSRQLGISLWLLPCLVSPLPRSEGRFARRLVVSAIMLFAFVHGRNWLKNLERFEREEARGLSEVLAAAPPRLRLHYVKSDMMSDVFRGGAWGHVEKFYMSDTLGDTDDVPAFLSIAPIRYQPTATPHRITYVAPDWPRLDEVWSSFDLVLIRKWKPTQTQLAMARAHADLLKESGDWQLWRTRH